MERSQPTLIETAQRLMELSLSGTANSFGSKLRHPVKTTKLELARRAFIGLAESELGAKNATGYVGSSGQLIGANMLVKDGIVVHSDVLAAEVVNGEVGTSQ